MLKVDAIEFLGGIQQTADAIGISRQAITDWPETLPKRIADRVIAAAVRLGRYGDIPPLWLSPSPQGALDLRSADVAPQPRESA